MVVVGRLVGAVLFRAFRFLLEWTGVADVVGTRHGHVGIAHAAEIAGARAGAEVGEHAVVALVLLEDGDLALRIVQVAERDRLGGAGLLAGDLEAIGRQRDVAGAGAHLVGLAQLRDLGRWTQ